MKILITYAYAGVGHKKAAMAIEKALAGVPDIEVKNIDFLDSGAGRSGRNLSSNSPSGNIDFAGLQRATYNNSNSQTFAPVIHFSGNVYGTDEFDKHVDKAMRNIKRNLS